MILQQRQLGIQRLTTTDRDIQRIEARYADLIRRRDAAKREWEQTGMESSKDFIRNNRRAAYEYLRGAADATHDDLLTLKGEA